MVARTAVAVAMFITFTPTVGLQMILSVFFAWLLRANKAVGIPIVWISNPATTLMLLPVALAVLEKVEGEEKGVMVFPEFAGTELLWEGDTVTGVRTGDKGVGPDGEPLDTFEQHKGATTDPDINPNYIRPTQFMYRLQKIMDEYAGGVSSQFKTSDKLLEAARCMVCTEWQAFREVTLGARGGDRVAVTAGLEAGERVVVTGPDELADGQRQER